MLHAHHHVKEYHIVSVWLEEEYLSGSGLSPIIEDCMYVPTFKVRVLVRFHRKHTAVLVLDFQSLNDQKNGEEEYFV